MKKALSLILIVSMLLSAILSFAAFADDDTVTVDGMIFERYKENECMFVGAEPGLSGDVFIPGEVVFGDDILPLTYFYGEGFEYNDTITSITFPDSHDLMFYASDFEGGEYGYLSRCKALKRVVMGKGNEICDSLFSMCESLEEVVIPEGVEKICINAFNGCSSLKSVKFPASVNSITSGFATGGKNSSPTSNRVSAQITIDESSEYYTVVDGIIFSKDMTELVYYPNYASENYTIPSGVKTVFPYAFSGCTNLKNIIIPESVENIYRFSGCTNLVSITVDNNNKNYASIDGVLFSKDLKAIIDYPNSRSGYYYKVPETVIYPYSFSFNTSLRYIELTKDVDDVDVRFCNLISLELNPKWYYKGCYEAKNLIVPIDDISLFGGEVGLFGQKLETIFYMGTEEQWRELMSLPDNKGQIDENSVEIVYNYKFMRGDCTGDGEINNKDVVVTFRFCSGTDVNAIIKAMNVNGDSYVDNKDVVSLFRTVSSGQIPKKDEPKENEANETEPKPTPDEYFEFTLLEDDTYEIKAKDVNNMPENVVIPEKHEGKAVTVIGERAFEDCRSLINITIPDNITSICICAFNGCTNLKYNKYDNAGYLGNANNPYHALVDSWDPSRTSIDINEKTKIIAAHAFLDNTNIKGITIPDGVISIDDGAFDYCCHLTNVTIPDSVTYISSSAFVYCTLISVIKYKGTYNQWISVSDDIKWEPGVIDYLTIYCSDGNYTMQENKL